MSVVCENTRMLVKFSMGSIVLEDLSSVSRQDHTISRTVWEKFSCVNKPPIYSINCEYEIGKQERLISYHYDTEKTRDEDFYTIKRAIDDYQSNPNDPSRIYTGPK
jgi:hypothetical protein